VEGIKRVEVAGDMRRGSELIRELSLVAEAELRSGAVVPASGSQLQVHITNGRHFGAALMDATGSPAHLAALRAFAKSKGYRLDARGLWKSRRLIAAESEEEIYAKLGLEFIPPELREGEDEIALAERRRIPNLVSDADIRGIVHAHTEASDGVNTLEEMVRIRHPAGRIA
jgi:DNA polymerase (family 10)